MSLDGITAPKQQRSRESFARVKAATLALIQDPARSDFTLADVSVAAGVSIGSIYTRVQGKSDLIRVVQEEEFDRIDVAVRAIGEPAASADAFADAVTGTVRALIAHLVEHAPVLRAFMRLAAADPAASVRGMASSDLAQAVFTEALRDAGARWGVEIAAADAGWCFDLIFSVVGRHLGFGMAAGGRPRSHSEPAELADRLSTTVLRFLAHGESGSSAPA